MEIEQKERERIEKAAHEYASGYPDYSIGEGYKAGAADEHLHLQKEVIQPLRRDVYYWKSLYQTSHDLSVKMKQQIVDSEAEIKALRDGTVEFLTWMKKTQRLSIEAITAIDQLLTKK